MRRGEHDWNAHCCQKVRFSRFLFWYEQVTVTGVRYRHMRVCQCSHQKCRCVYHRGTKFLVVKWRVPQMLKAHLYIYIYIHIYIHNIRAFSWFNLTIIVVLFEITFLFLFLVKIFENDIKKSKFHLRRHFKQTQRKSAAIWSTICLLILHTNRTKSNIQTTILHIVYLREAVSVVSSEILNEKYSITESTEKCLDLQKNK